MRIAIKDYRDSKNIHASANKLELENGSKNSPDSCAALLALARVKRVIIECTFCFLDADHVRRLKRSFSFEVRHAFSTPFPGSPGSVEVRGGKKGNPGNEVARNLDYGGLVNEFLLLLPGFLTCG